MISWKNPRLGGLKAFSIYKKQFILNRKLDLISFTNIKGIFLFKLLENSVRLVFSFLLLDLFLSYFYHLIFLLLFLLFFNCFVFLNIVRGFTFIADEFSFALIFIKAVYMSIVLAIWALFHLYLFAWPFT